MERIKEKCGEDKIEKIAVYAGTRNYYKHMLPAFTSLLENSSVDKVFLLIEDSTFPYSIPDKVSIIDVSRQPFFHKDGPNFNSEWTYMTMLRVALPYIITTAKEILWLDVDTIVNENIDVLWYLDIEDYYFAAAKEIHKSTDDFSYFNAGVMLINCSRLIKYGMCSSLIQALNTIKFEFPDQDCINEMCMNRILEIPSDFNVCPYTEASKRDRIIHFTGEKDWSNEELYQKYLEKYNEVFGRLK